MAVLLGGHAWVSIRKLIKENMLDGMEELTLQVSYWILFISFRCKGCVKGFPVIKYTYVACYKVTIWFVLTWHGLIVFMVYWEITYSGPCQTTKTKRFLKPVTFKEITSLLRRLKSFWIRICWMKLKQLDPVVAVYLRFEITCTFCHLSTVRFPLETLSNLVCGPAYIL